MENIIEVKNLKYKYDQEDEKYTLNDVSFHVKQGEWLSIIGHNGSGKSTTVRLIDGLLEAESGDIYISGDKLTADNVWEKRRLRMISNHSEGTFGRLRYLLGGDRPSQTAHLTLSPITISDAG